jgi:hypothetical protein
MTNRNSGSLTPLLLSLLLVLVLFAALIFIGGPLYNVWQQALLGGQNFRRQNILGRLQFEAQAKKDSAQQLADAEVIRAKVLQKQTKSSATR